jgi:hypothetical protein
MISGDITGSSAAMACTAMPTGGADDAQLQKGAATERFYEKVAMFSKGTHRPLLCFSLESMRHSGKNGALLPRQGGKIKEILITN